MSVSDIMKLTQITLLNENAEALFSTDSHADLALSHSVVPFGCFALCDLSDTIF